MNFRVRGSGDVVLFLHGTAAPETLYDLADRLSDDFRSVVPALPGYADSAQVEGDTPDAVRDALLVLLDEVGADSAHIVGHSSGAYHALNLAAAHPERVVRLGLLAPLHHVDANFSAELAAGADAVEAGRVTSAELAPSWVAATYLEEHPEFAEAIDTWLERDRAAFAVDVRRVSRARDLRAELGRIEQAVYVRVGELDGRTPVPMARDLVAHLPDARLDVVDGVGHFIQAEQPGATAESLRRFLL